MGLNFMVGKKRIDACWSYGGFGSFRQKLAKEIGINLKAMENFSGMRKWSSVRDPIKPLLNHSDCDGQLSPAQCAKIAPRLRELVQGWPDFDFDKRTALLLAKAMDLAVQNDEPLVFT